jgi:hypothetical protein
MDAYYLGADVNASRRHGMLQPGHFLFRLTPQFVVIARLDRAIQ